MLKFRAGDDSPELYTLYYGWAFRFKTLPDGRRQILNFLLPGDLIGLQAAMFDGALHGIEALTDVELCVLPRRKVWALFGKMPDLAFDVTWLGSREESLVDENLTSVGRRTAEERIAALIVKLYKRANALGLVTDGTFTFPLTQQHIADALVSSIEPSRPERPSWPTVISVLNTRSCLSVLLARSFATHLAGSA